MIYDPRNVARKPQSPCFECPDRAAGCHSTCGLYADYKVKVEAEKAAAKAVYDPIWNATNYVLKRKQKLATTKKVRDKHGRAF